MKELSKAEEKIMLAVWRLKENAYGVSIRKKIFETAGKDYTYGTLYGILEQMVRKQYVNKVQGEPTPERGGRRKTFYQLTPTGIEALKKTLVTHKSIWQGISEITLDEV